ncbi:kxDL motif-containing protein CG10681 [Nematostella vectensis]|uniref:kxDL motif-containing protein CG10681 n=1 Tax=Nematostella vectensis TaxID=45351 RepID=UPI0020773E53|nr:kxDL motif-containing protein CG10681 [Nematostella vectensis]
MLTMAEAPEPSALRYGQGSKEEMPSRVFVTRANTLAADEFCRRMSKMASKEDVKTMETLQIKALTKFEKTNETFQSFNHLSSIRYEVLNHRFKNHTTMLLDMKKDLDIVFRRIRTLKSKLSKQYGEAFLSTSVNIKKLEELVAEDQEEEKPDRPGRDRTTTSTDEPGRDRTTTSTDEPGRDRTTTSTDEPGRDRTTTSTDEPGRDRTTTSTDEPGRDGTTTSTSTNEPGRNRITTSAEGLPHRQIDVPMSTGKNYHQDITNQTQEQKKIGGGQAQCASETFNQSLEIELNKESGQQGTDFPGSEGMNNSPERPKLRPSLSSSDEDFGCEDEGTYSSVSSESGSTSSLDVIDNIRDDSTGNGSVLNEVE